MHDFNWEGYDGIKIWISDRYSKDSWSWEKIKRLGADNEADEPSAFYELRDKIPMPLDIGFADWIPFIEKFESTFGKYTMCGFSDDEDNGCEIPSGLGSFWDGYKSYLRGNGREKPKMSADDVKIMELNCGWILRHLKRDTEVDNPVRGLVMGSVQSGKTANMIGLVTMAADYDWNVFVVLTGTIENLRQQTRDRFVRDLRTSGGENWHVIDSVDGGYMHDAVTGKDIRPDELRLNGKYGRNRDYRDRYVFVCLKNSRRLERLIDGLHFSRECSSDMRILLIDDEADQASINTKKIRHGICDSEIQERTVVNRYIVDLVMGRNCDGALAKNRFQAMNYVSYTATPYANVLNEAGRESLYPGSFICSLPEPDEYFGAKTIFGGKEEPDDYPGLNIVRTVPDEELKKLTAKSGDYAVSELTELKNALAWFLCAAAVSRRKDRKKPVSMLVHTSARQGDHFRLYGKIFDYLMYSGADELLKGCRRIYDYEIANFSSNDLRSGFKNYPLLDSVGDDFYPSFEDIEDDIRELIGNVKNIELDSDNRPVWEGDSLYLCVDNCRANFDADYGIRLRVAYPSDEELEEMDVAPAFIVIGGNTLSRGLTLEGLVCTYFVRDTNQADTLMQMARWFGFRRGYELLPRIWMTEGVKNKFELMEEIDEKLKIEFTDFMRKGLSPSQCGPKIMNSYKIAKFQLTAKNRSQSAVPFNADFSDDSYEVTKFENDEKWLRKNIDLTEAFLRGIGCSNTKDGEDGSPHPSEDNDSSFVWRGVDSEYVIEGFLKKYKIFDCCTLSVDIPIFVEWLKKTNEEGKFLHWNVVASGNGKSDLRWNPAPGVNVGKIKRSKKKNSICLNIGSLRSGKDELSDVRLTDLDGDQLTRYEEGKKTGKNLKRLRSELGLAECPMLLLYLIDKESATGDDGESIRNRMPLNADCDIVGFAVIMAGEADKDYVESLTVLLPEET